MKETALKKKEKRNEAHKKILDFRLKRKEKELTRV